MSTTPEKHMMDWLRDAHAMEEHAEDMLRKTAMRVEDGYAELAARLREQADLSGLQAQRVQDCIARLGGDTSALKDLAGKAVGTAQALSGLFASDEPVKAVLAIYTFTHMEIGSYRTLSAAAKACADVDTQRVCDLHLAQERDMAQWLESRMAALTERFLQGSAQPATRTR